MDPSELTIDVHRGNCQAHAFYDICRILPNIKLIRGAGTLDDDITSLPEVCPLLVDWFENSGDGFDFVHKPNTTIVPEVEYFFESSR